MNKDQKRIIAFLIAACLIVVALLVIRGNSGHKDLPDVYIAWSNIQDSYSFLSTLKTVEEIDADPVVLEQVESADLKYDKGGMLKGSVDEHGILTSNAAGKVKHNTWKGSNIEEVMEGVDCVIVPGGWDISPTLYRKEQKWHGIEEDTEYSAERDVSDYLLISYCLDNDIPILAICRGMQMLSVVSGADMIQDIPSWQKENGIKSTILHRDPKREVFVAHDVTIEAGDSLLHKIAGTKRLKNVPSWHHQAVGSVKDTKLIATAYAGSGDEKIIEGVERPDLEFCIGVQYHPEVAVKKYADKEEDAGSFMDRESAIALFEALKEKAG